MNQLVPPSEKYRWLFVPWMAVTVGVFWVIVRLIEQFDWNQGKYRAAILALVLIATPFLMRRARGSVFSATSVPSLLLAVSCVGLMCWHFVYFAKRLSDPSARISDITSTTLMAGDVLLEGENDEALSRSVVSLCCLPSQSVAVCRWVPILMRNKTGL
jgi:hypothetical protein